MDKRKLRLKSSLHKNLVGSQLSSSSKSSFELRLSNDETLTRKRRPSREQSDDDSELPSIDLKAFKRRREESKIAHDERQIVSQKVDPKNVSTTPEKRSWTQQRSFNNTSIVSPEPKSQRVSVPTLTAITKSREAVKDKPVTQKSSDSAKKCKLTEFLHDSGITLTPEGPHILNKDLIVVEQKMKDLLTSGRYTKTEIISLLEKYIEDEKNLENALADMEISDASEVSNVLHSSSIIRTMLQVNELHPEIYNSLLSKLNEAILLADSIDAVPWTQSLLQQFRFLDIVMTTDTLTNHVEQLLESCPSWFQVELILFLPDIVTDKQHHAIAEILNRLLEENPDLTNCILDCMGSLSLGPEYLDEYKEKVLNLLTTNLKMNTIPAIVKFVLEDCTKPEIFKKTVTILRNIEIQPLVGENVEECYKNQMEIVNSLKMKVVLSKESVNIVMGVIKNITKDPKPLDIIWLLLIFSFAPTKKKNVEALFKQHIRSGFYRQSLLSLLYNDYKQVVQELQASALQLSSILLKSDEHVFVNFAIDWFRLQFITYKDKVFKQREILEKIIHLMGTDNQTAKNALAFLSKMVIKEEDRQCLEPHCSHLRILLEKVDNLSLEEVGTLNDLLHNLCTNSSTAHDALHDDLLILLQKQLSAVKPLTKCKGVFAAVMSIKHLMRKEKTAESAHNLFKTVLTNVKNCPRSQALFYDQLAQIIDQTPDINVTFIKNLTNYIEEQFVNTHMIDRTAYSGELVPKFGLNNSEEEPQNSVLNFEDKKYGAIVPITFKLLRTCYQKLSNTGDLDAIDALLGCAILMPDSFDIADNSVVDLVICCINWFRDVIGGFVMQPDPLLKKQVLERLDNLIYLQNELCTLLSLCELKYQPPPCYFHHFPVPPFVRTEKKVANKAKKGKKRSLEKSMNRSESEPWEVGSTLCSKNPTYFRKLDAKIAHLLDIKTELHRSKTSEYSISQQQVCFIVKELLSIFDNECNETFVKDLIHLLPKICSKLQDMVEILREENNGQTKEAVRLLLCLITKIFSWKGFESVTYNALLREGLRTLAGQINEANGMLRSCKELVAESYKYFESLSDIATQISLAVALINVCQSLMKHSETYTKECKDKHAKMAFGFLSLAWPEDKYFNSTYKAAVNGLLNNWVDNESEPLNTITNILEWLPDEISKLEKPQDSLARIPSITRSNFHALYKKIFDGLIKGVKIAWPLADTDPERIEVWRKVAQDTQNLVQMSKVLKTKNNVLIFLRYMPILLRLFLSLGMPILEHNLKYQMEDVTRILKMMQGGTRYLHAICCDSAEKKDITLTKYVPAAKSVLERLVYSVKGMLVLNNSPAAFWMGNLVNKNLDGREILSQNVSSNENTLPNINVLNNGRTTTSSEILDSDLDDEPTEDCDDI